MLEITLAAGMEETSSGACLLGSKRLVVAQPTFGQLLPVNKSSPLPVSRF